MQSSSSEHLNELKTQLVAREGTYHLVPHAEYSRPKVSTYAPNNGIGVVAPNSTPVRVSFAKVYCTDLINSPNTSGGNLGNPFLPTIHYNRISHSNDGLNAINNTVPTTNHIGVGPNATSIGTSTANASVSSASSAYLNHHSDNSNDHSHLHRANLVRASRDFRSLDERIVFNIGREVFVFAFNGLQPSDLTKLVDRRNYKASFPTCHDISNVDNRTALMLIGFNTGQIQFVDLYRSEVNRFYNSERLIEKSKVTCVRWLPRSKSNFLVSYSTGQLYLYKEDLTCGTTAPNYQQFKGGEGFTIFTCKTKTSRNPIFRWSIGEGAIHEFAFSPCGEFLAIVSQDGFLRVFHYDKMELVGRMRSYFGGLLCLDWSPDSKFIVTGGEDDLITVWSLSEKRVVARGQGHKSWVNVVAFDPYMIDYNAHSAIDSDDFDDNSLEDGIIGGEQNRSFHRSFNSSSSSIRKPPHHDSKTVLHKGKSVSNEFSVSSYRIGSVGQDTQICLWDLTDDIIRQSSQQAVKARASLVGTNTSSTSNLLKSGGSQQNSATGNSESGQHTSSSDSKHHQSNGLLVNSATNHHHQSHHNHHNAAHHFFNSLIKSSKSDKSEKSEKSGESHHKHHKSFSLSSRSFSDKHHKAHNATSGSASGQVMLTNCTGSLGSNHAQNHSSSATICDPGRLLGTAFCPRLDDVPMLEPHVCKKVAHERLTELIFRKDYIAIANQDGKVSLFARPSKSSSMKMSNNSPNASSMASDINDIACDDNSAIV